MISGQKKTHREENKREQLQEMKLPTIKISGWPCCRECKRGSSMLQRNALVLIQEDALHGVTRLSHSQLQLPTQHPEKGW